MPPPGSVREAVANAPLCAALILEVDGPQHFWRDAWLYTDDVPKRDAEKARWALAQGRSVVRVLANDVRHDRSDWRRWLRRAIGEARVAADAGAARVLVPEATEYWSEDSEYICV